MKVRKIKHKNNFFGSIFIFGLNNVWLRCYKSLRGLGGKVTSLRFLLKFLVNSIISKRSNDLKIIAWIPSAKINQFELGQIIVTKDYENRFIDEGVNK